LFKGNSIPCKSLENFVGNFDEFLAKCFKAKLLIFIFNYLQVILMFRGCKTEDMSPHIYSLSQTAYRAMLETRIGQSLIFMGRSGSRKTKSFKHSLYFLTLAAGKNFIDFF
jgi:hypothetical protein